MHHDRSTTSLRSARSPARVATLVASGFALCATLALVGCQAAPPEPAVVAAGGHTAAAAPADTRVNSIRDASIRPGVTVTPDLVYGTADGTQLKLDVCHPPADADAPRPAVLSIHGGSWYKGDKASPNMRMLCRWLASNGFVAYSLNYRMVPDAVFPAAIDDVDTAVRWVRAPENAKRFDIDPKRVGVLGGSAGANLATLLGMQGHGPTTSGIRVSAVVDLSGPVDLTAHGMTLGHPIPYVGKIERNYLGCTSLSRCPQARRASAVYQVDPSDPPVFIAHSSDELIPHEQGDEFAAALTRAHVPHTVTVVPGHRHAVALLDAPMRRNIAAFLHRYLG